MTPLSLHEHADYARFTAIFRQYYSRLTYYARNYVHDDQQAQDIVQDCFLNCWLKRDNIDWTSGTVHSYLYTAVTNAVKMYFRKKESQHKNLPPADISSTDAEAIANITEAETYYQVFEAFQHLPPRCRNIFQKLYVEGKSYSEISRELNIKESTISVQKAKGLQLLKERLQRIIIFVQFLIIG